MRRRSSYGAVTLVVVLIAASIAGGCATSKSTVVDWNPEVDFSQYRTYDFRERPAFREPKANEAFRAALEVELRRRGFTRTSDDPDLEIAVFGRADQGTRLDIYTFGYSYWWGGYGATIAPRDVEVGTAFFDVVDAERQALVYRAIIHKSIPSNPSKLPKMVFDVVDRMVAKFPPKGSP